ncbi:MAG: hypothetical protein GX323_08270 [Clostridiales bacterium]|nr:hypothetical protein [Clostridiales bacterium]
MISSKKTTWAIRLDRFLSVIINSNVLKACLAIYKLLLKSNVLVRLRILVLNIAVLDAFVIDRLLGFT